MASQRFLIILAALVLSAFVAVLNAYALQEAWYWRFWWFDLPMHFLGGTVVGAIFAWVAIARGGKARFRVAALAALAVGIAWEIFEYAVGATFLERGSYPLDTAIDIVLDVAGALAVVALVRHDRRP